MAQSDDNRIVILVSSLAAFAIAAAGLFVPWADFLSLILHASGPLAPAWVWFVSSFGMLAVVCLLVLRSGDW